MDGSRFEANDYLLLSVISWASLVAQLVRICLPCGRPAVRSLGRKDPLEKGKAIHASILAWRIPWTVYKPMGLQRV